MLSKISCSKLVNNSAGICKMASLPEPPIQLKAIQGYMKIAADIERRDPIVAYWIRLYCTETALKIDKDSAQAKTFLSSIILWLEKFKQTHKGEERVSNQTVGQAHVENYVLNIFNMADSLDRNGEADKKTVAMFFMASLLFETLAVFGSLSEDIQQKAKYSKFKAAYIQKCLKLGQKPKPGPIENEDLEDPATAPQKPPSMPSKSDQPSNILSPSLPPSAKSSDKPNTPLSLPDTPDKDTKDAVANDSINQGVCNISSSKFLAMNGAPLKVDDLVKSQKYCKFAASALQYDDIPTAVNNLEKALALLKSGEDLN